MPTTATTNRDRARRPTAQRARRRPRGHRRAPALRPREPVGPAQLCLLSALEMRRLTFVTEAPADLCAWCLEHGPKGCPACTQRRRKAVRLADAGRSVEEISAAMQISVARVERLLEQARDRAARQAACLHDVPNAELRRLFERRKAADPTFSAAELARRAGLSCSSHAERLLGLIATSDAVKNGVTYPGRILETISAANAEKLLKGLGRDPWEVDRLLSGLGLL